MTKTVGNFTRGGQIWAHNIRMLTQVLKHASYISIGAPVLWFVIALLRAVELRALYIWLLLEWAEFKLAVAKFFYGETSLPKITVTFYYLWTKQWQTWPASSFSKHGFVQQMNWQVEQAWQSVLSVELFVQCLWLSLSCFIVTSTFFFYRGRRSRIKKLERGTEIVSPNNPN